MPDPSADGTSEVEDSADEWFETVSRVLLLLGGIALLVCGVVAAFTTDEGTSTAALLAAGFGVAFVGYLGRYITRIRFGDIEADLERVRQKAKQTLRTLESLARSYETVRAEKRPGGARDAEMDRDVASAMRSAQQFSPQEIEALARSTKQGDRIVLLGLMKARPDLWDFDVVLHAIANPHAGFDQDRFLVLAADMLHTLDVTQRNRLRETVQAQRSTGPIWPDRIRWLSSERLLRLMDR